MLNRKICATMIFLLLLVACGPDTIYVRPSLDTPQRHVINGNALLEQGKIQDAFREFKYASELDSQNVAAMVGMATAMGYQGKFDQGLEFLEKAEAIGTTAEDQALVLQGYARLEELRANN